MQHEVELTFSSKKKNIQNDEPFPAPENRPDSFSKTEKTNLKTIKTDVLCCLQNVDKKTGWQMIVVD